ncbi:MAG: hypothetical protein K9N23_10635 [Akkermansiaceae bacterium]|nr:hypothetical protein [Akkermansiaceae bacterium]
MPVETLPTDSESLVKIWRPQAALRAEQGESEFSVARFLHAKGVAGTTAREIARELVSHPDPAHSFSAGLGKTIGIVLLILGLLVPVLCFVYQWSGFITIAALLASLMGVAAACKLLWPA